MIFTPYLISIFVAWVTFSTIKIPKVTPARASSFISLIGFFILFGSSRYYTFDVSYFSSLIFGASFVGMCSHKVFKDLEVVLGALLYTTVYIYLSPQSLGVGGALGFSAFVSLFFIWTFNKYVFLKR